MGPRRVSRWLLPVGLVMVSAGLTVALRAEEALNTSSRSSRSSSASSRASTGGSGAKVLEGKLNEVLDNQQKILKRLDEVMAELQIVKIRATMR